MTHTRIYRSYELGLKASGKDDKIFGAGGGLLMPYCLTKRYWQHREQMAQEDLIEMCFRFNMEGVIVLMNSWCVA